MRDVGKKFPLQGLFVGGLRRYKGNRLKHDAQFRRVMGVCGVLGPNTYFQDGFEGVCQKAEDGEKFYTAFHKIITKLSVVESKYVKGLNSLKQLFADSQQLPAGFVFCRSLSHFCDTGHFRKVGA